MNRAYGFADKICLQIDVALRSVVGSYTDTQRVNPAQQVEAVELSEQECRHAAGLMRVNHVGEVCAQALYQGQALTARQPAVRASMAQAANEEVDHLVWCQQRLHALNGHISYLNPVWYAGAFSIGVVAGAIGDKWSLGFVAETEKQVVAHLDSHLGELPENDRQSRAIVQQMAVDEAQHAKQAIACGAVELPKPIKKLMQIMAKMMTRTAYYL